MQIKLKAIGKDLYIRLINEVTEFPKAYKLDIIEWQIEYSTVNFGPTDLVGFSDAPSVILVNANDTALVEKIQKMDAEVEGCIKNNPDLPLVRIPIIFIFNSQNCLLHTHDFPDFVSDWVFSPVAINEIARRVLAALKRQRILKTRLEFGLLMLVPETNTISYEGKVLHLPQSEFMLAELFFKQMGMVIPFKDLIAFFKSKGKSCEANNIRVAIFQLRLKLEMLTKSQIMLSSIYKKGYCMRLKSHRLQPAHETAKLAHDTDEVCGYPSFARSDTRYTVKSG